MTDTNLDLDALRAFHLDRVLSQSSTTGSIYLLGTLHDQPAIVHLQRTVLPSESAVDVIQTGLSSLAVFLENKPYFSADGFLDKSIVELADLVVKVIWPATEVHIRKYTAQARVMVQETPETYHKVVVPYIESFPPERLEWVYNILEGRKEVERVLFNREGESGFMILPDLKWDQTSMSALYLTVLVHTRAIKSMRDLSPTHLPLLRDIRSESHRVTHDKFGVDHNKLRLFVHYQPSYYHFHVHVVHIEHEGLAGMTVGQAHLLDDIISLLELSSPSPAPSLLAKMTLTYAIGVEHGLYPVLQAAQSTVP